MKKPISLVVNINAMPREKLEIEEIEKLGYYDFMGYLEVPFFNVGGAASMDRLAELLGLDRCTKVLEVGCGTGGNACYLANKYSCSVTGIDIAEQMVTMGQVKAEELGITDLVDFKRGNAYDLDFPDGSFDVVFTIFVSQFLEPSAAFREFNRVLRNGGRLGINEMYKEAEIPPEAVERVEKGEKVFREITDLPFNIRSDSEWRDRFEKAGFQEIAVDKYVNVVRRGDALKMVDEFGGWWKITKTLWEMLILATRSKKIRQRIGLISKGKQILLNDRVASKYLGYILCVGHKS
jgi:ubiquinone/menaquinone biosynthesis C-methylase UbiE